MANREIGPDLKSKEGASDLVQEALLEAHRDRGKFVGRTETELRRWLHRILLHKIAHSLRRYRLVERRRVSLEISLDSGAFDGDADWLAADQTSPGGRKSGARKRSPWALALDRLPEQDAHGRALASSRGLQLRRAGTTARLLERRRPQALAARLGTAPARAETRDSHVSTGSVDDRENQLAAQAEALDLALAAGEARPWLKAMRIRGKRFRHSLPPTPPSSCWSGSGPGARRGPRSVLRASATQRREPSAGFA